MRIAMLSYHACPLAYEEGKETGGMQIYVLELSKALVKLGHQVDVFTRIQDTNSPEIVNVQPGLRVSHLPSGLSHFSENLKQYIRKNNLTYDIIHAHYYKSGAIALKLKQPFIMSFHTLALMKNKVSRITGDHEPPDRVSVEHQLIGKSSAIIASSELDKEHLINLYHCEANKITVINPGVDTAIFKPGPVKESSEKIILYVGRIDPVKGIDALMHAIKIIKTKNPSLNISLLIVGGTNDNKPEEFFRLKKLQSSLGIAPIVGFISQRQHHELPYYYNNADVVVLPSYYESFGMTALEAMACEIPVIITNTSGISNLFDKQLNDLIVSANNPLQLARQIENSITNESFRQSYKTSVRKAIHHLTWTETAKKTEHVYLNFLHHHS